MAVVLAPLLPFLRKADAGADAPGEATAMGIALLQWLCFRLMFQSGVVKLTSGCPTWWDLSALTVHYESQCIPTPVAWAAHQLPRGVHLLSTLATYVLEIGVPFLYFFRLPSIEAFCVGGQLLLMAVIALTGNYNFFNLLTGVISLALLSDDTFAVLGLRIRPPPTPTEPVDSQPNVVGTPVSASGLCLKMVGLVLLCGAVTARFFMVNLAMYELEKLTITPMFTSEEFAGFIGPAIMVRGHYPLGVYTARPAWHTTNKMAQRACVVHAKSRIMK